MAKKPIIPASGRPADLDLSMISSVSEADRVIWWLSDVITDMNRQIAEALDPDQAWLKKVKSARWWAGHLRHKAREARDAIEAVTPRDAIGFVLLEFLDDEDFDDLEDMIVERFPHLTGLVLRDVLR